MVSVVEINWVLFFCRGVVSSVPRRGKRDVLMMRPPRLFAVDLGGLKLRVYRPLTRSENT